MTKADQPSDAELMAHIGEGVEAALETLYERYSRAVYALCLRVLQNEADAEDIVVEVFWRIWEQADRYDAGRGSVLNYLLMRARSRAIDRRRALGRQSKLVRSLQTYNNGTADGAAPPEQAAWDAERRERVLRAMDELASPQREAVELAFFDGLTHQEIAERLDTPLGTIKTRIRSGLVNLRDRLQELEREDVS